MYLISKFDLTVCVLNEMKMYKCDEFLKWLVYSSKWEALLIDNILSMAACSRNIFSVCSIYYSTDQHVILHVVSTMQQM